jgi:RNA polymerase primary sigma factor
MTQTLLRKLSRKSNDSSTNARARSSKSSKATFRSTKLEESFVHFMQLKEPDVKAASEIAARVKSLFNHPIALLFDEDFLLADAEAFFLGETLLGTGLETKGPPKSVRPMPLPPHLARLCESSLLSAEEEQVLFKRMNYLRYRAEQLRLKLTLESTDAWLVRRIDGLLSAANWYRDFIVRANMRLVISIVKKFVNKQNGFDDLLSDGIMALIRAVEKFDAGLGFRFSTYATQVVRRNTYRRVMERQAERLRVGGNIHDDGLDLSDEQKASGMSEARWHDLRSKLSLLLDHLDRREKFIIRARFSLGAHRRIQTLQRLADILGVSKERVRQLEKRALEKLRGMASLTPLPEIDS